ncbi:MAG: EAL domain-containing protein [Lachnospiraceae bacterium]|nr:EAL domain-containing protein [Lachnospiraceae bacterium]
MARRTGIPVIEQTLYDCMEMIPGGFCVVQKRDRYKIAFANRKLAGMFGYAANEAINALKKSVFSYVVESDRERLRDCFDREKDVVTTMQVLRKDGSVRSMVLDIRTSVISSGIRQYLVAVSDAEEINEELQMRLSNYEHRFKLDPLSGLYNKESFYSITSGLLQENPKDKFVIAQWNFDRFKAVNELYGSAVGDQIIRDFGSFMKEFFAGNGTQGRLEADHFVTCCKQEFLDAHEKEIDDLLFGRTPWYSVQYPIQIHAGFYAVENASEEVKLMCDRAGMALHPIKESYMTRTSFFTEGMREAYLTEQQMMRDVDGALAGHEFFVMYQPIINVRSRQIVSAEALVRWKKADGTIVPPGEFVPVFEKNGFVSSLDLYVCEEVCKYLSRRKQEGKPVVPVSVNLSRVDFRNRHLNEDICALLTKYDLTPECLKIEITESAYMDRPQELTEIIATFQNSGFKVLMDDFGSGFSSLNMLKDVSADILKIDMRFMDHLETSDKAGTILYSIIQMAKSIHMEVVAEGVETESQYELLFSMECDNIQGYYFYRPLPESEFSEKLDRGTEDVAHVIEQRQPTILYFAKSDIESKEFVRYMQSICTIRTVYDEETFLKILRKDCTKIDLSIVDMSGKMDHGVQLMKKIRDRSYLSGLPFVFFACDYEMKEVQEVFDLGALDVVLKPIDWEMLYQRIRKQIRELYRQSLKDAFLQEKSP